MKIKEAIKDADLNINELAKVISLIVLDDYGEHNCSAFIDEIKKQFISKDAL